MSQYVRHFLEEAIGSSPAGFSAVYLEAPLTMANRFKAANSSNVAKYLGDRYCTFNLNAVSAGKRGAFGLDAANADPNRGDFEVLHRVHFGTLVTPDKFAIGGRCSGSETAWNGYFAEVRRTGATLAIVKAAAGVDTDLATVGISVSTSTTFWVRFQCRGASPTLKVKYWQGELTDEPTAWTLTYTDNVSPIAGPGLISVGGKGATTDLSFFFVCIGTGTDDAPRPPKTWAEYLAFLSLQDTLRCVLFEVDVLGQDSVGAVVPARVCMSNFDFRSQPSDPYPNIAYEQILIEAPKNRRKVNVPARDKMTMTYGDAIFKNEVILETDTPVGYLGRLDHWLTWNWDGRQYRTLVGHPSWRRCDFKTHFTGLTQDIYRAGFGRLGFKTRGADALMQRPLTTTLIGGAGPNALALRPFAAGEFFNVDLTSLVYDANAFIYQYGPPNYLGYEAHDVKDSGLSLKKPTRTITAVNTGTDTITLDSAHNLVAGASVVFAGALPAPLSLATQPYYVKTVPAADQVTLAANAGGPTIDLTTATTGGTMVGRLYTWDEATGRVTLLSKPAGRVTMDRFAPLFPTTAANLLTSLMGLAGVLPDVYRSPGPSQAVGIWAAQQRTIGDAVNEIATSVGAVVCQTREGGFYSFVIDIPGNTPAWSIVGDLTNWRTGERFLPAEVERLGYQKNYTIQRDGLLGAVPSTTVDLLARPYSLTGYTPAEIGLEQPANHLLRRSPPERVTSITLQADAQAESQRGYNLYRKTCGTWLFNTGAWALATEPGDVVNVTHPRDGFGYGKNAVIVGIADDPMRGKVELEIFAQIDGQWPTIPPAWNPFVPGSYY